jgi:hypothetical protein
MGKWGQEYPRVPRDAYPSPSWVIEALAEHVELYGLRVWEPACGAGQMSRALKAAGAAVYSTDVCGYRNAKRLDFLKAQVPSAPFDALITNPPWGERMKLAERFIEAGLKHIDKTGLLALLLPTDFDNAKTRLRFFRDESRFTSKIVLTTRPIWFERTDGRRPAPRSNVAWFVWRGGNRRAATIRYSTIGPVNGSTTVRLSPTQTMETMP